VEAVEELVNVMSTRLDEAAKLIKQSKAADAATAKAKNRSE
jgi:hypothetical protein